MTGVTLLLLSTSLNLACFSGEMGLAVTGDGCETAGDGDNRRSEKDPSLCKINMNRCLLHYFANICNSNVSTFLVGEAMDLLKVH